MFGGKLNLRPSTRRAAMALTALRAARRLAVLQRNYQKGYVVRRGAGANPDRRSQEQVLILMGTPSTRRDLSGEVFYDISQRAERGVRIHAAGRGLSARGRGVSTAVGASAAGKLWNAGRQDLRLHQPHHNERRRRNQLFGASSKLSASKRSAAACVRSDVQSSLSLTGPRTSADLDHVAVGIEE